VRSDAKASASVESYSGRLRVEEFNECRDDDNSLDISDNDNDDDDDDSKLRSPDSFNDVPVASDVALLVLLAARCCCVVALKYGIINPPCGCAVVFEEDAIEDASACNDVVDEGCDAVQRAIIPDDDDDVNGGWHEITITSNTASSFIPA
jgi:hypothetical protein